MSMKLSLKSDQIALPSQNRVSIYKAGIDATARSLEQASRYPETQGNPELIKRIEQITPNWQGETLITNSATQALYLALKLIGEGKRIALREPCYFDLIRQTTDLKQEVITWTTLEELESLGKFDAVVLTSNHTPPQGISLSNEEKQRIADLGKRNGAWIIEDNAYDPLWFDVDPEPIPADPEKSIRIGSLSKIAGPSFRVGFIRATKDILSRIRYHKNTIDLGTSSVLQDFAQAAISDRNLEKWRRTLHRRSELLSQPLEEALGTSIIRPQGGPFLCLKTERPKELIEIASRRGLELDDNCSQHLDNQTRPWIRLNYAALKRKELEKAGEILSRSIKDCC